MKKVILFAAVASLAFVSCKKEHDCTCTSTYTFAGSTSASSTQTTTYKDVTKRNAKTLCVSSTTTDSGGGVTTSECTVE